MKCALCGYDLRGLDPSLCPEWDPRPAEVAGNEQHVGDDCAPEQTI